MPVNLEKRNQLFTSTETLWTWLRQEPKFLFDYDRLKHDVSQKKIPPFEIIKLGPKTTYKIIIPNHINFTRCNDPKDLDKRITFLKVKLVPLATRKNYDRQENFRRKWGFYPMFSPFDETPSESFFKYIRNGLADGRFDKAARSLNFNAFLPRPVHPAPSILKLEIDWRQGDRIIIYHLKKILKTIRRVYGEKPDRSRHDFAELVIKNGLLRRAGLNKTEIKQRLMEQKKFPPSDVDSKESYRKTLERAYSKAL